MTDTADLAKILAAAIVEGHVRRLAARLREL
jgi:hypothetical protein